MPYRKGVYRGNANSNSRLTEDQVRVIKLEQQAGVPATVLARIYSVSAETIRRIAREENWGWLKVGTGANLPDLPAAAHGAAEISAEAIAASQLKLREKLAAFAAGDKIAEQAKAPAASADKPLDPELQPDEVAPYGYSRDPISGAKVARRY